MPVEILPYDPLPYSVHTAGVGALCAALGWPSLTDPDLCRRVLSGPGVVARIAVDGSAVVGFGYGMGDGALQSYLAQLAVTPAYRRRGIARRLVEAIYDATGTQRMDLLTDDAQAFYEAMPHQTKPGYRIYPRWEQPD
ncbi:GNAT family N-acetyltransferase [Nocardioides sp. KR10-350]|uniref:GNAT family N-acetyltransferase n=1 Tax=Nocardioides cheoyonin TaxID=3156615 RepID=UPI0032B4DBB9